jgi:hypothetical protein
MDLIKRTWYYVQNPKEHDISCTIINKQLGILLIYN